MNIWNTVFLVLVTILAGVAVYFTAYDMQIKKDWNESILELKTKISDTEKERVAAITGPAQDKPVAEKLFEEMSLGEMTLKLQDLVFERGTAWFGCQPGNIKMDGSKLSPQQLGDPNPQTPDERLKPIELVEVKLTITGPVVERDGKEEVISPEEQLKGVVYLFNEGQEGKGGAFLGRFTVISIQKVQTGYQVTLHAANELNESEKERIRRSNATTWAIYSSIPKDRYQGVFDRLVPDDAEAIISPANRALLNPDRKLQDFDILLSRLYQRRVILQQEIDHAKRQIASLNQSREIAVNEEEKWKQDIEFEKKRKQAMKGQLDTMQAKVAEMDRLIKDMEQNIDKQQKQNEQYVAGIAEYHLNAARLIEHRAEEAAQQ